MGRRKELTVTGNPLKDRIHRKIHITKVWVANRLKSNAKTAIHPEIELKLLTSLRHGRKVKMWAFLNEEGRKAAVNETSWSLVLRAERAKIVASCSQLIRTKCIYRMPTTAEIAITDAGYTRLNELESILGPVPTDPS